MNISSPFIRLPVMTTLVMLGILLFGTMGYLKLPVSDLPNVDFPTISISASLPGANPETMAAAVATPLERQFSTIEGIESMVSTSALGATSITITFALSRNIDAAALDVQSSITAALKQLPTGMPSPPTFKKVNPADSPILYLALTSDTQPISLVDEYGETMMAQRISMVSGVAQVLVYGSQKYAVRIQADPSKLAALGVTYDDLNTAIQNGNVNLPMGTLYGPHQAYTVEASGQLMDAAHYEPLIVAYHNGAPVRLRDVAVARDDVQNDKVRGWYKGERPMTRAVVLAILRQPGTNTVKIVDDVRKLMPSFRTNLPASVNLDVIYDRSQTIRSSVDDVERTLLITILMVVLVIFLFLRNPTATIIPSMSLPMSIVGTFATMYVLGFNLDNLSLMALTLSAGFVVDDAIVVLENIVRRTEEGETVNQAVWRGTKQIGFTVLSMTLSLVAVFIPIIFMNGILGRLFREFAVTITASILISGFISLTLTPMLCHRFLRAHDAQKSQSALFRASEAAFRALHRTYEVTLRLALRGRLVVLGLAVLMLGVTFLLFRIIPMGLLPTEDTEQIFGITKCNQDVSFDAMVAHQKEIASIVAKNPNVAAFFCSAGAGGSASTGNQGIIFMHLTPHASRKDTPEQIIGQLRAAVAKVPGIQVIFQVPPPIRFSGRIAQAAYQYTLQGTDVDELYHYVPTMVDRIRAVPGVADITTDLLLGSPRLVVDIDRDKAASLGITAQQIENTLAEAYGSNQVSTIYTDVDEFWVVLESIPEAQLTPNDLNRIYIRPSSGALAAAGAGTSPHANAGVQGLVPLSTFVKFSQSVGPLTLSHQGQLPAVTIFFNLKPGFALGDIVKAVDAMQLPVTITGAFQGDAQVFEASKVGLSVLLLIAIAVIYMVLGILYESFIHPFTILSGLPSAGIGALATLMIFHVELNIYAFVGIILLIGIVKKNAIMMIDFAISYQREAGVDAATAIERGCLVRFRPIMMTTMAALMGTIPIAFGWGGGSNSRRDLGMVVVGGLVFSQFVTLYITPVVYIYMDRLQRWLGRLPFARPMDAPTGNPSGTLFHELDGGLPEDPEDAVPAGAPVSSGE